MDEVRSETTVTQGLLASVPAAVRRRFGIEPGDTLVWKIERGKLTVDVRRRRGAGFADFRPFDFGQTTDAAQDHDEVL